MVHAASVLFQIIAWVSCAQKENQNLALDACKAERSQTQPFEGVGHIIEMAVNYGTTQITKRDALSHHWPHPVC